VNPPARGSFPLDHHGLCKPVMSVFLACLERAGGAHGQCRDESRSYLKCRMDGDLMAPEDLDTLGFGKDIRVSPAVDALPEPPRETIAGLSAAKKGGGFLFGLGGGQAAKRGGGH
jgi:cytochrome c oxidase assembly protein subunit 19